eukprot:TRINITY_DN7377_c0_g1_i4.p1 TRINITY_DN7377_c0_g1~~TRINITY_DN7377_c0_g1_i4.p1  ORF type:complete len:544 (-),score=128.86 TRINITY_DN7377_c0_g1_i4:1-1632(-)
MLRRLVLLPRYAGLGSLRTLQRGSGQLSGAVRAFSSRVHPTFSPPRYGRFVALGLAAATGTVVWTKQAYADQKGTAASEHKVPLDQAFPVAYQELHSLLGDRVTTSPVAIEPYGKEGSGYMAPQYPQAVVWPLSTEEVAEIVKICAKHGIPIVPYAAGTSLEGHTTSPKGGVTMDIKRMGGVLKLNAQDMDVVVQPGIGWMELNDYLRPHGFFLGVDPAPGACIGGMCGTCCSGTNAVRYGTMKDQVVNLTVVLADGTIVKTGQRARKSSAGYDLARLFVGSEGTLGIVTEATLKVRNIPEYTALARVSFDDVHAASAAVIEILQKGVPLGAVELLDEEMVKAVNQHSGLDLPITTCLLFKFTGPTPHVRHDIDVVRDITGRYTTHGYHWTRTEEESETLWMARKTAFWAAQSMRPGRRLMATDVAVPISRLAECISETKKELDASFLFCPIVGHVGDGNFHVVIMFDPEDPREAEEAHRLNSNMVLRAISMEGTCTGEHGVGIGKKKYLSIEKGEEAVRLMQTLKRALDPQNILNPGKIVDV